MNHGGLTITALKCGANEILLESSALAHYDEKTREQDQN
jgi:hypothetical protein